MNPVFLFLEVAATVLFVGAAGAALRRGRLPFLELISAAAFGLLLEEGDQLIFQTYHYSSDWVLVLDRAPLIIGLTWALLIAGAMRITDALGVRRWTAPFVDAVLVIMLDLAFDAVAIRIGMWTWVGVAPDQGWFGVPAGNFYAWLFVTLGFSLLTRWLRDAARTRRAAMEWLQLAGAPPCLASAARRPGPVQHPPAAGRFHPGRWPLALRRGDGRLPGRRRLGVWGPDRIRPDGEGLAILDLRLALGTRVAIEGFFLVGLLLMGGVTAYPVLLVAALLLLAAEVPLGRLVHARHTRAHAEARRAIAESGPARAGGYRDPHDQTSRRASTGSAPPPSASSTSARLIRIPSVNPPGRPTGPPAVTRPAARRPRRRTARRCWAGPAS